MKRGESHALLMDMNDGTEQGNSVIESCITGDAILPQGTTDNLHALFVQKHIDGSVTYHASRHDAYRGEHPMPNKIQPEKKLSQLDVIEALRLFVHRGPWYINQGPVHPQSLNDIRGTVSTVVGHAIMALLFGMIPAIGSIPLVYLTVIYAIGNYHLLCGPKPGFSKLGMHVYLPLYLMVCQCLDPALQFLTLRNLSKDLPSMEDEQRKGQLKTTMMYMQLRSVSLLCSIATIFMSRILAINTIKVFSDIAYYKALAEERMKLKKRSGHILELFKRRFTDVYEPFSAPLSFNDRYFQEDVGIVRQVLTTCSAFTMFVGLALWHANMLGYFRGESDLAAMGNFVMSSSVISMNWTALTKRLFGVVIKINRNAKQLVLCRTLNIGQDFTVWDKASKDMLKDLLEVRLGHVLKAGGSEANGTEMDLAHVFGRQAVVPAGASGGSFKSSIFSSDAEEVRDWFMKQSFSSGSRILEAVPDCYMGQIIAELIYGAETDHHQIKQLDLSKVEDAKAWWELRQFLLLDFADESCLVDYAIAVTLLLLGCFCCIGFLDWTTHKDNISEEISKLSSDVERRHCLRKFLASLCPMSGLVVACTTIAMLSILFFELVKACVTINKMLDDDAKMLRDTMLELQLQDTEGSGHSEDRTKVQETLLPLISSMLQSMQDTDNKQKLFGFVVDAKMQNGFILSVASVIVSCVWKQFSAAAIDLDLDKINYMTKYIDKFVE